MSLDNIAERFAKLRSMREKLCKKEKTWTDAFQARDWVLDQLKDLQAMIRDDSITREDLDNRVCDLLCVLEPKEAENDNG